MAGGVGTVIYETRVAAGALQPGEQQVHVRLAIANAGTKKPELVPLCAIRPDLPT